MQHFILKVPPSHSISGTHITRHFLRGHGSVCLEAQAECGQGPPCTSSFMTYMLPKVVLASWGHTRWELFPTDGKAALPGICTVNCSGPGGMQDGVREGALKATWAVRPSHATSPWPPASTSTLQRLCLVRLWWRFHGNVCVCTCMSYSLEYTCAYLAYIVCAFEHVYAVQIQLK